MATTTEKTGLRFRAQVNEAGDGELFLYDEIGGGWFGVSASDIVKRLDELKADGAKNLNVYVNSPGGDVFDGMAVFNAIKRWDRGSKTVTVDGLSASMASVIMMAADPGKLRIAPNAMVMIHEPWGIVLGTAGEMRSRAELLDTLGENILATYEKRTKQSAADLQRWMADETWMTAEQAKARGFVDEILSDDPEECEAQAADLSRFPVLAKFRRVPGEAAALLARGAARVTARAVATQTDSASSTAATSRHNAAASGTSQEAAQMDPVATTTQTATPAPATQSVTMSDEQFKALLAATKPTPAPVAVVPSPVTEVIAAASGTPSKPEPKSQRTWAIMKYHKPNAVRGREKRSDEKAGNDIARGGLRFARYCAGVMAANEYRMPVADACDFLGYEQTADGLDAAGSIAKGAAMSEGDAAAGGSFTSTALQAGFIDMLDDMPGGVKSLIPAGNIVRSSSPTIQWPKLTTGFSGAWVGENPTTGSPESLGTGAKTMTAKKMRVEVLVSRQLLRDNFANLDQVILQMALRRARQLEDIAIFEGTGASNQPRGLLTVMSQASHSAAQTADKTYENARADLRKCLKTLATSKVDPALGRAFVGSEDIKWGLGDLINPAGFDYPFAAELEQGRLLGKPAAFSGLLTSGYLACFAPGDAVFFEHLALLVENDNVYIDASGNSKIASGADQTVLRIWREIDFDVMHDESVYGLTSVTWGD